MEDLTKAADLRRKHFASPLRQRQQVRGDYSPDLSIEETNTTLDQRRPISPTAGCRSRLHNGYRRITDRHRWQTAERRDDSPLYDLHICATAWTGEAGTWFDPGQRPLPIQSEQILHQGDQPLAVGMQEAEVMRATEAFGQNMLQDQPQELGSGNGPGLGAIGFGAAIAEGHLSVLARQDVLLSDHPTVEIAPQIDQRLLPVATANLF